MKKTNIVLCLVIAIVCFSIAMSYGYNANVAPVTIHKTATELHQNIKTEMYNLAAIADDYPDVTEAAVALDDSYFGIIDNLKQTITTTERADYLEQAQQQVSDTLYAMINLTVYDIASDRLTQYKEDIQNKLNSIKNLKLKYNYTVKLYNSRLKSDKYPKLMPFE